MHEDALHNPDPKPLRGNNIVSYYRSNLEHNPAILVEATDLYLISNKERKEALHNYEAKWLENIRHLKLKTNRSDLLE